MELRRESHLRRSVYRVQIEIITNPVQDSTMNHISISFNIWRAVLQPTSPSHLLGGTRPEQAGDVLSPIIYLAPDVFAQKTERIIAFRFGP